MNIKCDLIVKPVKYNNTIFEAYVVNLYSEAK